MNPSFAQLGSTNQRLLKNKCTMNLLCALPILVHVKGVNDVGFSADYKACFRENNPKFLAFQNFESTCSQRDAKEYELPDDRALAARYLLLYEMSLPFGLDLTNQIDINKRLSRVSITLKPSSQSEIEAVVHDINEWAERHKPNEVSASVTGPILTLVGALIMDFLLLPALVVPVDRDEVCGYEACLGSQDNLVV